MKNNTFNIPTTHHPRIVIIGGGFGGIQLAKKLCNIELIQLVLLDRHNYHTFQPLLYQVATVVLEPDSIIEPLRAVLRNNQNCYFRIAEVQHIDTAKQVVITKTGELRYDYLILANGSTTNYFGNDAIQKYAFPLKKINDALTLRNHLLQNIEQAIVEDNIEQRTLLENIVIVGGGPTGVELAGAIAELRAYVLPNDYPELDISTMQIYLIEAMPRLLSTMSSKSSQKALKYLRSLGVNVMLTKHVKHYNGTCVTLDDESTLLSKTLIWAAGVQGDVISGLSSDVIENKRIIVNCYNQVKGYDNIFAIGDIAAMIDEKNPKGYPMVASVAIQQGRLLAKNIQCLLTGATMKPFSYFNKGTMAIVGKNKAMVDLPIGNIQLNGFIAWVGWLFVHVLFITSIRNKLVIGSNWLWNFFTRNRGMKAIIQNTDKKNA